MTARLHFAVRPRSSTAHIVGPIVGWYSGMTLTTECGVKRAEVLEEIATCTHAMLCKRCSHIKGWDRDARQDA